MKWSIIIPVYNRPELLKETLSSTIGINDAEIIVIDDGSSSENARQQKEVCKQFRCNYFWRENKGISQSRNDGLKKAIGEYIFFLDSDDIITKEFIIFMNTFNTNKQITRTDMYSWRSDKIKKVSLHPLSRKRMTKFDILNWSQVSSFIFKRKFLIDNNLRFESVYSEDNLYLSDLLDLYSFRKWGVSKVPAIKYRVFTDVSETKDTNNLSAKWISYLKASKQTKFHLAMRFVIMTSNVKRDISLNKLSFTNKEISLINKKYKETLGLKTLFALPAVFKFRWIKFKLFKKGFLKGNHA